MQTVKLIILLSAALCAGPAKHVAGQTKKPAADVPSDAKYLMLDSRIIDVADGARLAPGKVEKEPRNPLFAEDQPWEVRFDNLYANVIYDEDDRIYKCWYSPFIVDPATTATPEADKRKFTYREVLSRGAKREMGICYATSQDGLVWKKPPLGIVEFDGSKQNNLVLRRVHGAGVWKDPHDSNPKRRYKTFLKRSATSVAFSPDGLHWTEPLACPQIDAAADTHNNAFWDPTLQQYVGITRLWRDGQRIVGRTLSADYRTWTKADEVLRGPERHLQTYAMPVFRYANVYLGLVMVFNTNTDLVDCELTWSPDGVHWEFVCPGTPLIPRGRKGSYDWGCIYAAAYPVFRDGQIRLYYGGNDGQHTNWRKGFLCLARLRPDGFAGMEPVAAEKVATIITRPVQCVGDQLLVSADAAGGSLRVAVLESPGFELDDCPPITADVTDGVVQWRGGANLAALRDKPVRLQFELRKAKLYAFGFGP